MCYAFQVDTELISPVQVVKLRKIVNISTVIMRREATFKDTMRGQLSALQAFEEDYVVGFFNVRIMKVTEDMMSSTFLDSNLRPNNIRYNTVRRMMNIHQGILLLPVKSGKGDLSVKTVDNM